MNIRKALLSLKDRDDWDFILDYLKAEREQAIGDFQSVDILDNSIKLARLSGEIAALDRLLRVFTDEQ
jgi:hypothetical protein